MPDKKQVGDFDVFKEMSKRNKEIAIGVDLTNMTRHKKKNGGLVTMGIASPGFDWLINDVAVDGKKYVALLYVINRDQFNEIKKELENL